MQGSLSNKNKKYNYKIIFQLFKEEREPKRAQSPSTKIGNHPFDRLYQYNNLVSKISYSNNIS